MVMRKTTFSMPTKLYERMNKYLEARYGATRGRMAVFLQDAIREKLDRDENKKKVND